MITLVDTSAWVEYLRGTGSAAGAKVRAFLSGDEPMATTDIVYLELLAGARSDGHAADLERLLNRCVFYPVRPIFDYADAARIYRTCRGNGITLRSTADCLVAAIAIDRGCAVLHHDRDFDGIAACTGLIVSG